MTKAATTTVEKAIARFIRALQERNSSVHTIKAYRTDLEEFSAYVGPQGWGDIDHVLIRGYLSSSVRARTEQNLCSQGTCGASVAVPMAGAGGRGGSESGKAGGHAEAA